MEQKFRLFCFTDFVCDGTFWEAFYGNNKVVWLKYGNEYTKEDKHHFQGVVYFKSPRTLRSVIKLLKPRHVEICKGSADDNDNYVSKDGDVIEFGTKPSQGQRNDLENIKKKIDAGASSKELADENFGLWCQYGRRFEEYRALIEVKRNWVPEVIILQGLPGTGKTTKAVQRGAIDLSISGSYNNPFVSGYNGEDVVLFDDFNPEYCSKEWFLKITGAHPMNINTKGGCRNWKPRKIFITTNTDARQWWRGDKAWIRRITSIENFE